MSEYDNPNERGLNLDRRDSSCTTTSLESGGSKILKRELLMGVAEHCVADFISTQTDARQEEDIYIHIYMQEQL